MGRQQDFFFVLNIKKFLIDFKQSAKLIIHNGMVTTVKIIIANRKIKYSY